MKAVDFKAKLRNYRELVNTELAGYLRHQACPEQRLNQAMEYSLMTGGKRLRPILTIATCQLFNDDYQVCLPFALALEMVHNFSLIHDDLPGIDNDDFRHGKLTNHKQFDEATAILAGDGLLNGAYMVLSSNLAASSASELPTKLKVLHEFSAAIDRMIAGEYVDTVDEGKTIAADELTYIHQNKTGALLRLAVRMGAMLGGANDDELTRLTDYADKIGLAFQIKDDILSVVGDEKITGKPVGNDQAMGKCTFVSQYGLTRAQRMLDELTNQAIVQLDGFGELADFLRELANYTAHRNK